MSDGGILLNKKINKIFFVYNFGSTIEIVQFLFKNFFLFFISPTIFALKEKYRFF